MPEDDDGQQSGTVVNMATTPSILIDNYEEVVSSQQITLDEGDQQSDMNNSDHSPMTNSVELKLRCASDQDADVDTESEMTHHHSRLLRLLSNEADALDSLPPHPTAAHPVAELEAAFQPLQPGVRLRIKSRRAKDRIPSRVFRSLQHEFDSSTEDIQQAVVQSSSSSSAAASSSAHLYASTAVTPETPSSATSELEGFFQASLIKTLHPMPSLVKEFKSSGTSASPIAVLLFSSSILACCESCRS